MQPIIPHHVHSAVRSSKIGNLLVMHEKQTEPQNSRWYLTKKKLIFSEKDIARVCRLRLHNSQLPVITYSVAPISTGIVIFDGFRVVLSLLHHK